jgi:hypothetical protein
MKTKYKINTDLPIVRAHVFRSVEQDLSLALSFCLYHLFYEMRMQTVSWSSFISLSWFLLILGRWIGVHQRCKLKFLLDSICFKRHGCWRSLNTKYNHQLLHKLIWNGLQGLIVEFDSNKFHEFWCSHLSCRISNFS